MQQRMLGLGWRGRLAWIGLGLAAVALAAWLAVQPSTPFGQAQEPKATPTPQPGEDCFGGALSDNPLHCYVLAAAHSEGVIEVDAVYRAGRVLLFFLAQTEPVSDEVYRYIEQKALSRPSDGRPHKCPPVGCGLGVLPNSGLGYILPLLTGHEDLKLVPGGAEARRSMPGWASFRQLWPVVADGTRGAASAATGTSDFDVSDVNTTTLPDLDCNTQTASVTYEACLKWERFPGLGIAGWSRVVGKAYVQVKAPPGQEDNVAAVAREELHRRYPRYADDAIVIIPVKYDYQDLWRWTEVLQRFVTSSANTIGIWRVDVGENRPIFFRGENVAYPLPELQEAGRTPGGRRADELRTTIHVLTLELQRTVDALPVLLPLLGIPVDAVGVVAQIDERPEGRYVVPATNTETSRAPQPVSQPPPPPGSQASAGSVTTDTGSSAEGASGGDEAKPAPDGAMAASEGASDSSEGASDQVEPAQAVEPASEEGGVSRWILVGAVGALAVAGVGLAIFLGLRRARKRA